MFYIKKPLSALTWVLWCALVTCLPPYLHGTPGQVLLHQAPWPPEKRHPPFLTCQLLTQTFRSVCRLETPFIWQSEFDMRCFCYPAYAVGAGMSPTRVAVKMVPVQALRANEREIAAVGRGVSCLSTFQWGKM